MSGFGEYVAAGRSECQEAPIHTFKVNKSECEKYVIVIPEHKRRAPSYRKS